MKIFKINIRGRITIKISNPIKEINMSKKR